MNIQLQTFNFKSNIVRAELIENEPYFCLSDVCSVMDIKNSRRVNAEMLDQKGVRNAYTLTNGGKQELTFINEPNLYRIIFKSRKAEAVEFQNWVFDEVLPQIRKTGKYEKLDTPILLTKEHQQFIKDFVKNRTLQLPKDKQAKCAIMQWSALKSHFGKSYKEIDDSQFVDAISLLARLPLEGELIDSSTLQLSKNSQNTEATLEIMVELYGYCLHAYEMQEKLSQYPDLADRIDSKIGGQYLYNLKHPLENAMTKAKRFIRNNSEKLTIIKAVDHLLN